PDGRGRRSTLAPGATEGRETDRPRGADGEHAEVVGVAELLLGESRARDEEDSDGGEERGQAVHGLSFQARRGRRGWFGDDAHVVNGGAGSVMAFLFGGMERDVHARQDRE
ncbi:MAG: hypothetical protein ACK55I_19715, partial [bacterium]